MGARKALAERFAALARAVFYGVLLVIFARVWAVVAERGVLPGVGAAELLWYLSIAEWIVLSIPSVHLRIEAELRRGEVAYHVIRPIPYAAAAWAEASGELFVRLIALGASGGLLTAAL